MRALLSLVAVAIAVGAWLISQENRWTNAVTIFAFRLAGASLGRRTTGADRRRSGADDPGSVNRPPPP
ncbi:MAG: hypothetical protein ACLQJR_21325 [Stellaceae bacterium]